MNLRGKNSNEVDATSEKEIKSKLPNRIQDPGWESPLAWPPG